MPRTLAAVAVLLFGTSDMAAATTYNEFRVGDWEGYAHRSERSGEFTHCAIKIAFPDDTFFTFGISRDNVFTMFFGDYSWRLPNDGQYTAKLSIDGESLGALTAFATGGLQMRVVFGTDRAAFEALRRGKRLSIKTPLRAFSFPLKKTARALPRLQDCADKETAAATAAATEPAAGGARGQGPSASGPAAGARAYTRAELTAILAEAGLAEPQFLAPEVVRRYPGFKHMWDAGEVVGFVSQHLRDPNASIDQQMGVFLANFVDGCPRGAESGVERAETRNARALIQGFVSCAGGKQFYVRAIALFEESRLNILGYIGWGAGTRAPADAAGARLADALRRVYF